MAGRPSLRRELAVWMNDRRVGRWSVSPSGAQMFAYDAAWLEAPGTRPLSLSLPLLRGTRPFRGAVVESFFEALLPASALPRWRLQTQGGCASPSAFDLLSFWGRDCFGAVRLLAADDAPGDVTRTQADPLDAASLARALEATLAAPDAAHGVAADEPIRSVLPGSQAKLALLWHDGRWCRPLGATPTSHIAKLPLGARSGRPAGTSTSLENEWLCSRLLAAYGFAVAPARLETMAAHKVLVTERFDRRQTPARWWARLPAESMGQALGAARPARQTPDLASALDLLRGADDATRDRERFFIAAVMCWMLAAVDRTARHAHLLLLAGGAYSLSPLCGLMSAWPIVGRSPAAASLDRLRFAQPPAGAGTPVAYGAVSRADWLAAARRLALGPEIAAVIDGLAGWTERAIDTVSAELPDGFPPSVSESVFGGLRRSARTLTAGNSPLA